MNNDNETDNFLSLLNSCYDQITKNIDNQISDKKDSLITIRNEIYNQLTQHIKKLEALLSNIKEEVKPEEQSVSKTVVVSANSDNRNDSDILIQKIDKLEKENEELKRINNEQFCLLSDIKISVEQLKEEKENITKSQGEYKPLHANVIEESFNDVSNTSILCDFLNGIADVKMGITSELVTLKIEDKKPKIDDKLIDLYSEPERIYLTETMLLNQSLKKILKDKNETNNDFYKTPKTQNKSLIPSKYTANTITMKNEKKKLFATLQNVKKVVKQSSPSKDKENMYPIPSKIPKGLTPSGKTKIIKPNKLSISKTNVPKGINRLPLKNTVKAK